MVVDLEVAMLLLKDDGVLHAKGCGARALRVLGRLQDGVTDLLPREVARGLEVQVVGVGERRQRLRSPGRQVAPQAIAPTLVTRRFAPTLVTRRFAPTLVTRILPQL